MIPCYIDFLAMLDTYYVRVLDVLLQASGSKQDALQMLYCDQRTRGKPSLLLALT